MAPIAFDHSGSITRLRREKQVSMSALDSLSGYGQHSPLSGHKPDSEGPPQLRDSARGPERRGVTFAEVLYVREIPPRDKLRKRSLST